MITKPIRFVQIAVNMDHIFGLTPEGEVFYRDKPPHNYGYDQRNNYGAGGTVKKDDADEKKSWKKLFMEYKYEVPKGGQEREAQAVNEPEESGPSVEVVVDEPAKKIYKDTETVKSVQTALKEKGLYKETYKIDGDLGKLTQDAIKEFQKSLQLKDTGEIDLTLWNALGLNKGTETETIVEFSDTDMVEDDNEIDLGA